MSFSSRILADSSKRDLSIHDGTAQCSLGIVSVENQTMCNHHRTPLTVIALRLRDCRCLPLELRSKRHIVKESPRVVELGIPRPLQILHRLHHIIHLFVPHQRKKRRIRPGRIWVVGRIFVSSRELARGLFRRCEPFLAHPKLTALNQYARSQFGSIPSAPFRTGGLLSGGRLICGPDLKAWMIRKPPTIRPKNSAARTGRAMTMLGR